MLKNATPHNFQLCGMPRQSTVTFTAHRPLTLGHLNHVHTRLKSILFHILPDFRRHAGKISRTCSIQRINHAIYRFTGNHPRNTRRSFHFQDTVFQRRSIPFQSFPGAIQIQRTGGREHRPVCSPQLKLIPGFQFEPFTYRHFQRTTQENELIPSKVVQRILEATLNITSPPALTVSLLPEKSNAPEEAPSRVPEYKRPPRSTVTEALPNLPKPHNTAPSSTESSPLPSIAFSAERSFRQSVPSFTATSPVLSHTPLTVILPLPTFSNLELAVTVPAQAKSPSHPTCHVLTPVAPSLAKKHNRPTHLFRPVSQYGKSARCFALLLLRRY